MDPDETLDSKRDSLFAGTPFFLWHQARPVALCLPGVGGVCVMAYHAQMETRREPCV